MIYKIEKFVPGYLMRRSSKVVQSMYPGPIEATFFAIKNFNFTLRQIDLQPNKSNELGM